MSIIRWSTGFRLSFLQAKSCGGNWNVFGGNNQKNENWSLTPGHPICFLWMPHDSSNNPCDFRVFLLTNLMKEAVFVQQSLSKRSDTFYIDFAQESCVNDRVCFGDHPVVFPAFRLYPLFFLTGACPQILKPSGLLILGSRLLLRWSTLSRWWQLKHFLFYPLPTWGNDPIWRSYFSNGLVQPPIEKSWGSSDPNY